MIAAGLLQEVFKEETSGGVLFTANPFVLLCSAQLWSIIIAAHILHKLHPLLKGGGSVCLLLALTVRTTWRAALLATQI